LRYYKIQIESGPTFTSVVNGQNDPGALDVDFDVIFVQNQSDISSHIKIRGIDPKLISQAYNFNDKRLQMWAGYTNGLPLANVQVPHQGLILDGKIWPCFGNWIFNELSLEFFVIANVAGTGGPTNVKNIVHNMPAGQPLSTALKNTLQIAFPQSTINMNISPNLKLNYPDWGIYQSLEQLGNYVKSLSHSILGNPPKYKGVTIATNGNNINVSDGTQNSNTININYVDLVGQPTWIGAQTIQVTTLLRGDISLINSPTIKLPQTLATQTQQSAIFQKGNVLNFQGTWQVVFVKHIGRFRNPSYDAWVTIINATQNGSSGGAPGDIANQSGKQTFSSELAGTGSST
jgi:hypothetical protein